MWFCSPGFCRFSYCFGLLPPTWDWDAILMMTWVLEQRRRQVLALNFGPWRWYLVSHSHPGRVSWVRHHLAWDHRSTADSLAPYFAPGFSSVFSDLAAREVARPAFSRKSVDSIVVSELLRSMVEQWQSYRPLVTRYWLSSGLSSDPPTATSSSYQAKFRSFSYSAWPSSICMNQRLLSLLDGLQVSHMC